VDVISSDEEDGGKDPEYSSEEESSGSDGEQESSGSDGEQAAKSEKARRKIQRNIVVIDLEKKNDRSAAMKKLKL
jgi:hypothetical protein